MKEMDNEIKKAFTNFGIKKEYLGMHYLSHILTLTLEDKAALSNMTKMLYADTAHYYKTSPYCVERDIRTIINILWERGNRDFWNQISGIPLESRPSNGDFICYMTCYLLNSQKDAEK